LTFVLLYIPMARLLILAIFLSVFNLSATKAAKFYSASAQKLIINGVALGEEITVTESDLTELVNDIQNDSDNIDGTIFIRIFFKKTDRNRIENIIKDASKKPDSFKEPLIEITKTPDTNATRTKIKYAQVNQNKPILSSLLYHWADSIQFQDTVDKYTFSVKNFKEIERNSIVIFQMDIDNVWNYTGDLKFTIKLLNEPPSNTGGDSGTNGDTSGGGTTSGSDSTAVESGIQNFSVRVENTQDLLNKNYLCNSTETNNVQDICTAADLQALSTSLSTRIEEARQNKSFLDSLSLAVKKTRNKKEITKSDNLSLQNQIKKSSIVNKALIKELKLMKATVDKFAASPGTFESVKRQKALLTIRSRAQSRVNRVDSLVNAQLARDLLDLGFIDQATFSSL